MWKWSAEIKIGTPGQERSHTPDEVHEKKIQEEDKVPWEGR